jgi:hypothetical protein
MALFLSSDKGMKPSKMGIDFYLMTKQRQLPKHVLSQK